MLEKTVLLIMTLVTLSVLFASILLEVAVVLIVGVGLALVFSDNELESTTKKRKAKPALKREIKYQTARFSEHQQSEERQQEGQQQHQPQRQPQQGQQEQEEQLGQHEQEQPSLHPSCVFAAKYCTLSELPADSSKHFLQWLESLRTSTGYFVTDLKSTPIHTFKPRKYARGRESFMRLERQIWNDRIINAYLVVWKGKMTPEGEPSHVIALVENGVKNFELGRINLKTRPSQVRLIPHPYRTKDPVPCFQVGSAGIMAFSSLLRDYCLPVEKAKMSLMGVSYKPIEFDSDDEITEQSVDDDTKTHDK